MVVLCLVFVYHDDKCVVMFALYRLLKGISISAHMKKKVKCYALQTYKCYDYGLCMIKAIFHMQMSYHFQHKLAIYFNHTLPICFNHTLPIHFHVCYQYALTIGNQSVLQYFINAIGMHISLICINMF